MKQTTLLKSTVAIQQWIFRHQQYCREGNPLHVVVFEYFFTEFSMQSKEVVA
jgi:hypothetical protein